MKNVMHLRTQHALPRRWPGWAFAVLSAAALACGLPAIAAASGTPRKVLVLGVSDEGKQQENLRRALGNKVERSGAMLVSDSGLADERRGCDDPSCLRNLAREFGADLLLSARMERHGRFERLLDLWIFDAASNRDFSGRNLCDSRVPEPCLTELGGRLLAQILDGQPAQPPSPTARRRLDGATPANPGPSPAQRPPPLPGWRLALGITLSIAAATSLGLGIGYSVWRGQPTDGACPSAGSNTRCAIDGAAQLTAGYVLGGLATAAATATFAWPRSPHPKKETLR